jgi:hypothetical protein
VTFPDTIPQQHHVTSLAVFDYDPPASSKPPTDIIDELVGYRRPIVEPHGQLADLKRPFAGPIAERRRNAAALAVHNWLRPLEPRLDEPLMEFPVKGGIAGRAVRRLVVLDWVMDLACGNDVDAVVGEWRTVPSVWVVGGRCPDGVARSELAGLIDGVKPRVGLDDAGAKQPLSDLGRTRTRLGARERDLDDR